MKFLRHLFSGYSDTEQSPSAPQPAAPDHSEVWKLNEKGLPVMEAGIWRFMVSARETPGVPLWRYCAVKDVATTESIQITFSHYAPSENLAKQTAVLHLRMGLRPSIGIVELAPTDDEMFEIVGELHYQDALCEIAGPRDLQRS